MKCHCDVVTVLILSSFVLAYNFATYSENCRLVMITASKCEQYHTYNNNINNINNNNINNTYIYTISCVIEVDEIYHNTTSSCIDYDELCSSCKTTYITDDYYRCLKVNSIDYVISINDFSYENELLISFTVISYIVLIIFLIVKMLNIYGNRCCKTFITNRSSDYIEVL